VRECVCKTSCQQLSETDLFRIVLKKHLVY